MSSRLLAIGSLIAVVFLVLALRWTSHRPNASATIPAQQEDAGQNAGDSSAEGLVLYCAAGTQRPVAAVVSAYEKEYGLRIKCMFGGSGTLLNNLQITGKGDLYIAADASYIDLARSKGLLEETIPLARQRPLIAVAKGNPKKIAGVKDLLRENVKVSLANPDAASIGKLTKKILQKSGQWDALERHVQNAGVFKPTVMEVANDIKLGAVDAGIVWDSTANQYRELEAVHVEAFDGAVEEVAIAVLKAGAYPTQALKFMRYLQAPERGGAYFKTEGYETVEGDAWTEHPEITLFCGAMLRPAIDELINAFEKREDCTVTRVYNGCGILVGQLKAGSRPDAYFSCDSSYFGMVKDLFKNETPISGNQVVLVVQKGNPKGLQTLEDLCKPGLNVGVCNPDKSALGGLTQRILEQAGLYEKFAASGNSKPDSATGDFLVNQLRVGSLDAILVYASNVAAIREHSETLAINQPAAFATQPYGIAKDSKHPYLMDRLFARIRSEESRKKFESLGFTWKAGEKAP